MRKFFFSCFVVLVFAIVYFIEKYRVLKGKIKDREYMILVTGVRIRNV